jgi:hypothetical protein
LIFFLLKSVRCPHLLQPLGPTNCYHSALVQVEASFIDSV